MSTRTKDKAPADSDLSQTSPQAGYRNFVRDCQTPHEHWPQKQAAKVSRNDPASKSGGEGKTSGKQSAKTKIKKEERQQEVLVGKKIG